MSEKALYHTVVENRVGIHGPVKVVSGGNLQLTTANPISADPGTNPEQMIGLALATSLNATIEADEHRRGLKHESSVQVGITMLTDDPGFQFKLDAQVIIPQVDRQTAHAMLARAEKRCPVAKLLQDSSNVTVHLVDHFDFTNEKA